MGIVFAVFPLLVIGAIVFFALKNSGKYAKENERILGVGFPASGKVLSIEDLKNNFSNEWYRRIKINIEAQKEDGSSFQTAAVVNEINVSEIANYAPGTQVKIKVDPDDNTKSAIDAS